MTKTTTEAATGYVLTVVLEDDGTARVRVDPYGPSGRLAGTVEQYVIAFATTWLDVATMVRAAMVAAGAPYWHVGEVPSPHLDGS